MFFTVSTMSERLQSDALHILNSKSVLLFSLVKLGNGTPAQMCFFEDLFFYSFVNRDMSQLFVGNFHFFVIMWSGIMECISHGSSEPP